MTGTYGRVDPGGLTARERDPASGRRGPHRQEQKDRSSHRPRPRKALVAAGIVAAVLLVGAGVFALTQSGGDDDETTVKAGAGPSTAPAGAGSSTPNSSAPATSMTMPPDLTTNGTTGKPTKNTVLWGGTRPDEADPSPLTIPLYVDCTKSPCELGLYGKRIPLKGGKFAGTVTLSAGCNITANAQSSVTAALSAEKPGDTVTHLTGTINFHDDFQSKATPAGQSTCAGRDVVWDVDIPMT